jgi:nucleoside-diphosphate-sugar epimerase
MRFLITGGAGFIGSHLAEALLGQGNSVVIVDDLSTGSIDNIRQLIRQTGFEFVRGSVRDQTLMTPLVDRCDVIYHLAAAVGVQLIVDRPVHTIETNIHGSEVVLNLANTFRRRVLVASTSEVYGKNGKTPFNEDDDTLFGSTRCTRWSYACSKMIDEFLALAYHDQDGLEAVICRFFNTVGPRQTGQYGMVIPRFVQRALKNEPIEIYGNGQQSRCFCNVADVVDALLKLVECEGAIGEVINIGSNESTTIEELADKITQLTGSISEKRFVSYEQVYGRPFDDMFKRVPDLSKIQRLIGFRPRKTLDETLLEVTDFERSRLKRA